MIGARCGAPSILVYSDRGCFVVHQLLSTILPRAFYSPVFSSTFTYSWYVSPLRFRLPPPTSCLPLTTATTTRTRPRLRLQTEVPQVGPFVRYLVETSAAFSVALSLFSPFRLPHSNPKTPLVR